MEQEATLLPCVYKVEMLGVAEDSADGSPPLDNLSSLPAPNGALREKVFLSKVTENVKLTAEGHFQDTRKILLDLKGYAANVSADIGISGMAGDGLAQKQSKKSAIGNTAVPSNPIFGPGDIVMIQPKNDAAEVDQLIGRLGLHRNQLVKISIDESQSGQVSRQSLIQFPANSLTIFELFSYWLNLMAPPSR